MQRPGVFSSGLLRANQPNHSTQRFYIYHLPWQAAVTSKVAQSLNIFPQGRQTPFLYFIYIEFDPWTLTGFKTGLTFMASRWQ